MAALITTLKLLGTFFATIFPYWPVIILPALIRRTRPVVGGMVFFWLVFLGGWLLGISAGVKSDTNLIPEPLNTYLFLMAGLALIYMYEMYGVRLRGIVRRVKKLGPGEYLVQISPPEFKDMVVGMYRAHGCRAWRLHAGGAPGADVLIHTPKGEKWIAQCRQNRAPVGEAEVSSFLETMREENAVRGIFVTAGTFDNSARLWARSRPMVLVDAKEFMKTWQDSKKN